MNSITGDGITVRIARWLWKHMPEHPIVKKVRRHYWPGCGHAPHAGTCYDPPEVM